VPRLVNRQQPLQSLHLAPMFAFRLAQLPYGLDAGLHLGKPLARLGTERVDPPGRRVGMAARPGSQ
jgi:hypothetical protein